MRVSWKTASVVVVLLAAVSAIALVTRRSSRDPAPAETQISAATGTAAPSASHAPPPGSATGPLPLPPVVDLGALKAKLPDNLYWKLGVPVADAAEATQRAADEKANNELFGKVQSNTATDAEITRYYDHKRKLASDYATFARTVLDDYGPKLTPDEHNLYDLAIRMNDQRLKQLSREETLARGRHRAYEMRKGTAP